MKGRERMVPVTSQKRLKDVYILKCYMCSLGLVDGHHSYGTITRVAIICLDNELTVDIHKDSVLLHDDGHSVDVMPAPIDCRAKIRSKLLSLSCQFVVSISTNKEVVACSALMAKDETS